MIKGPLTIFVLVLALIVFLSAYLPIDDLRDCGVKPSEAHGCHKVDAIVAISGGDTEARAGSAIDLYQSGWGEKLVFSGAALDQDSPSNATTMRQQAVDSGVPIEAIYIDEAAKNTQQNAANVHKILVELRAENIILVTSGYHQRRASMEFSKYNPDIKILNHTATGDGGWRFYWWLNLQGWWLTLSEIAKIFIFQLGQLGHAFIY